jgi:hypothetical protein
LGRNSNHNTLTPNKIGNITPQNGIKLGAIAGGTHFYADFGFLIL